jgi:fatty acid desaturase
MLAPSHRSEGNPEVLDLLQGIADSASVHDDYSAAFHKIRSRLVDDQGRNYVEFVRGIRPDYSRVYRDIAFGYMMLIVTAIVAAYLLRTRMPSGAVIAISSLSFGYWIAYLQLFIHEAAHFNLAADRRVSDRLGNMLIAWMVGTSVAKYRKIHFEHHRSLGTTKDTEPSYFYPLNAFFIVKSLCGLRALEVWFFRRQRLRSTIDNTESGGASSRPARASISENDNGPATIGVADCFVGVLAHVVVVIGTLALGSWPLATAWIVGVGMVFPFFAALRPVLEHRNEAAASSVDYRRVNHGAFTRLFGDGPFSATFGGAGFNRHLLHHWEPQVSYTKLPDIERFLARTAMKPVMESRRTTYGGAVLRLFTLY